MSREKYRLGEHLAHYARFVMIGQRLFTAIMRADQTAVIQAIQVVCRRLMIVRRDPIDDRAMTKFVCFTVVIPP